MTTTFYVPSVISFPFCKTTNSVVDNVYTHEEGHQHASIIWYLYLHPDIHANTDVDHHLWYSVDTHDLLFFAIDCSNMSTSVSMIWLVVLLLLLLHYRIMIMMHQEFLSMGRVIHITANIAIAITIAVHGRSNSNTH